VTRKKGVLHQSCQTNFKARSKSEEGRKNSGKSTDDTSWAMTATQSSLSSRESGGKGSRGCPA